MSELQFLATASKQDRRDAIGLYRNAKKGYAEAQYAIGKMFLHGDIVVQNRKRANRWIGEAAFSGHRGAQWHIDFTFV